MQGISRDLSEMMKRFRTGTYCDKHSLMVKGVRVEHRHVVDFDEELGVYHGIETEFMRGRNGDTFCPECQRKEVIDKKMEIHQSNAAKFKENYMNKKQIDETSAILGKKSIIADETIKKATFSNFNVDDAGTERIKNIAFSYAKDILNGSTSTYVFAGPAGRGKSHIAMAILNHVNVQSYKMQQAGKLEKPFKCLYVSIPRMMSLISETYNMSWEKKETYPHTEERVISLIGSSDVVVFDDLGAELGRLDNNTKANDTITVRLMKLFDARQGKPTIVSTNLNESQMKQFYTEPVASRINSNTTGLIFDDTTDKRGVKK